MTRFTTASLAAALLAAPAFAQTSVPAMMTGLNGAVVSPVITVGEFYPDVNNAGSQYQFKGIPDGMGAIELDPNTVRLYVNHEFSSGGGSYNLANGYTIPEGARVSYFDIDKASRQVIGGGQAYDKVVDAAGNMIEAGNPLLWDYFARFCSANMHGTAEGFDRNIFFMGEEVGNGGRQYAIDTTTNTAYELGDWGKAAWESVTVVPTVGTAHENKSVFIIGDDRGGAPLLLYVGEKNTSSSDFLERNGLTGGQLYAWKGENNEVGPVDFKGTGNSLNGTFFPVDVSGSDPFGYATQAEQDARTIGQGAFQFSRPEDVHYDPISFNEGKVVMASTGRNIPGVSDDLWGTTYQITVDLDSLDTTPAAEVLILEDTNEADKQDFGIRSPDNLTWATDGLIYIQEDRSIGGFGAASGRDASIWRLDPETGDRQLVTEMETFVYEGMVDDGDLNVLGDWESSGIIDVSALFGEDPGSLLMANVQAHSLDPDPAFPDFADTVQGGQIIFIDTANMSPIPEPASAALLGLAGIALTRRH
ncbi:alkaline phosphatase PhoX [Mucisphaera calidilacus]|uniref:PEP-CTERM protein-sorting domain-containing protein n=1 Tax=Mucisphaera calidilacus TaxID=2527982 RepID=A0A518BWR3_9BACT|nr:alkaline phosphatase PhoX [Mucisphaera calidilacus]QDU71374.1 hypothetical protein Pan265_12230 [Mucisphaera calidilacus]